MGTSGTKTGNREAGWRTWKQSSGNVRAFSKWPTLCQRRIPCQMNGRARPTGVAQGFVGLFVTGKFTVAKGGQGRQPGRPLSKTRCLQCPTSGVGDLSGGESLVAAISKRWFAPRL